MSVNAKTGSVNLNILLPKEVIEWVDEMAEDEMRSRSNMISVIIRKAHRDRTAN